MIPTLSSRLIAVLLLAICTVSLAVAFFVEHVVGLRPCELCLTQRIPFAVGGALAGLALLPPAARLRRLLLTVAALGFLVNSAIAVYHSGVERKWWASSCAPTESAAVDVTDLMAAMSRPVEVRCDEPAWQWNGITIATLNIVFSGGLGLVALALIRRMERKP